MKSGAVVLYWDSSAILSALFVDDHSEKARQIAETKGVHLVSSLALAEVLAVIGRLGREGVLPRAFIDAAIEAFEKGPWRRLHIVPDVREIKALSGKWPLRGTDLWHLSVAKTLHHELPELRLLAFDRRLEEATAGENLAYNT